jgi:hypothetical protein
VNLGLKICENRVFAESALILSLFGDGYLITVADSIVSWAHDFNSASGKYHGCFYADTQERLHNLREAVLDI